LVKHKNFRALCILHKLLILFHCTFGYLWFNEVKLHFDGRNIMI